MTPLTDVDVAKSLVKQFYPSAADPALQDLLDSSKSTFRGYRPYIIAAYFIMNDYRRIIKADEVTFDYNTQFTVDGLLATQKAKDVKDTGIPEGWSVDDVIAQMKSEEGGYSIGVMVV